MGPRSTRNSSILNLDKSTPLVLDIINEQDRVSSIQACRAPGKQEDASRLMYVCRVSTGRRRLIADSSACSLELQFWRSKNQTEDHPVLQVIVHMPQSWTSKVYLAVLYVTMTTHSGISVKKFCRSVEQVEAPFNSLNNVHSFFACDADELSNILDCQSALSKVK
jgi:hypothetical protein